MYKHLFYIGKPAYVDSKNVICFMENSLSENVL